MKLSKAIKKIAAISSGAVMLGATVLGAMAADLSSYPSPFVKDGALDAILVVGAAAASSDVIGVTDIAASLQAKMTTPVEGSAAVTTVSGESALLASGSDHIYLGDELGDGGVTLLTSDDLPTILADQTFEDDSGTETDYEQTIEIGDTTNAEFTFDDSGNDLTDPALNIDLGTSATTPIYSFVVEFDSAINFTDSDVQGQKINLFGKEYTIGTDSSTSNGIQLLGGAMDVSLNWGETKTVTFQGTDYEITLDGVSDDNPDTASLTINGDSKDISQGSTKKIGGVDIYADTVSYYGIESSPGRAIISLGADELYLKTGNEVEVGSSKDAIDNTLVTQTGAITAVTAIQVDVAAQDNDYDDLVVGESYTDPVFGAIKVSFTDIVNGPELSTGKAGDANSDRTAVEVEASDDDTLTVKLTDKNGASGTIPFANDATPATATAGDMVAADEDGETIALVEGQALDESGTSASRAGYTILNNNGEYVGMVEVTKLNDADNTNVDLRLKDVLTESTIVDWTDQDLSSGKDFTYKGKTFTATVASDDSGVTIVDDQTSKITVYPFIELYNGYNHKVAITDTVSLTDVNTTATPTIILPTGDLTLSGNSTFSPSTGKVGQAYYNITMTATGADTANVSIGVSASQSAVSSQIVEAGLLIVEDEDATNSDAKEAIILTSDDDEGSNDDATLDNPVFTGTETHATFDDTDYTGYIDTFGSYVLKDASDNDHTLITVTIPKTQMYAEVYVSELSSTVSTTEATGAVSITPMSVGTSKLDTEVTDITAQNAIIVGGPCVNKASAAALGLSYPTCGVASTIPENQAIIKLITHANGKVALVVAGWSADDTRRASRVVAQPDKYPLSGESMVVSGTSMTDISVSTVTA